MRNSQWTDQNWRSLIQRCRQDGINLSDEEIREAAFGYMTHGADGGGNRHGLVGTVIALNVDRVRFAEAEIPDDGIPPTGCAV